MYLYQDGFNAKYFDDFITTLGLQKSEMNAIFYGAQTPFSNFFNDL